MKYVDLLEMSDYSFAIYDYDKETKRMIQKYEYIGYKIIENCYLVDCEDCEYYKEHGYSNNIDIFEILQKRDNKNENEK